MFELPFTRMIYGTQQYHLLDAMRYLGALLVGALVAVVVAVYGYRSGRWLFKLPGRQERQHWPDLEERLKWFQPDPLVGGDAALLPSSQGSGVRGLDDEIGCGESPDMLDDINELPIETRVIADDDIDLVSHDFLNMHNESIILKSAEETVRRLGVGALGPRTFFGTFESLLKLEERLSAFLGVEKALVYSYHLSTVSAAVATFCPRDAPVLIDARCNLAIRQGLLEKRACAVEFAHNDPEALRAACLRMGWVPHQAVLDVREDPNCGRKRRMLVLEGISARTGRVVAREMFAVAREFRLRVILDESLSLGVLGRTGRGITELYGLETSDVDMFVGSLEHAFHSIGGFTMGCERVSMEQQFRSSSYLYSAALPMVNAEAAICAMDLLADRPQRLLSVSSEVHRFLTGKYPNKYESIISTLCENLDTLDEPEARASMVWIIGEYAERIDNADDLLDSFLEGFSDENAQVQLQLLTAVVKLFLKRPAHTQALVQHVLSLATQDSDNPDLRDRGFIYWRLLSTDPAAAKEVVLAEKPLISEETDLLEPTLLDELICHISSLASVYHKPPTAFVEGRTAGIRKTLPARQGSADDTNAASSTSAAEATVIPSQDSLIGDLLSMDIGNTMPNTIASATPTPPTASNVDLLGGGLDILLGGNNDLVSAPPAPTTNSGLLGDIFGLSAAPTMYAMPKVCWLPADKGKGLEIWGTFTRRAGQISMDLTFTNKAMQAMNGFAIQFNKNSFGLAPSAPLSMGALQPSQTLEASLPLNTTGPVQRMEPLATLQVAVKNNVDVFYFACTIALQVLFVETGQLDKRFFLTTWKDIPAANEVQYTLSDIRGTADQVTAKMTTNNIFTIAKRNVEGQDMLYQSLKLTNDIWVLLELKLQPGVTHATLSLKTRSMEVAPAVFLAYDAIIRA